MTKKVLNGEQIRTKQQKQFYITYVVGLIAFIVLMVALNNNFGQDYKLSIDSKILTSPNIINVSEGNRKGNEFESLLVEYNKFSDEVKNLKLDKLNLDSFGFSDEAFRYVDENYTYVANDNYIKLTRQSNDVYIASYEDNVAKMELFNDSHYYLEYSESSIYFKVNDKEYNISISESGYTLLSNYQMDGYTVEKEVYDKTWNLVNLYVSETSNSFNGYFFKDKGYLLSEDELTITHGENSYDSTKYSGDNEINYTIMKYNFINQTSEYILLVNINSNFPF